MIAMSHDYKEIFAANLRELRIEAGLTQRSVVELLKKAGYRCSQVTWHQWESGDRSPPVKAMPFIAKTLGKKKTGEIFP